VLSSIKIWTLKLPMPQNFKYFHYLLFLFLDSHLKMCHICALTYL
jgi:hypothetical protein